MAAPALLGRGVCGTCYGRPSRHGTLPDAYPQVSGYEVDWVGVDQLRRDDLVVVLDEGADAGTDAPCIPDGTLLGKEVTEELAWLLGAIVGDGTVTYKSGHPSGIRVAAFGDFANRTTAAFAAVWDLKSVIPSNRRPDRFIRSGCSRAGCPRAL